MSRVENKKSNQYQVTALVVLLWYMAVIRSTGNIGSCPQELFLCHLSLSFIFFFPSFFSFLFYGPLNEALLALT